MKNKKCYKCKIEKPISEYYKNKSQKDGYTGACKNCTKLDQRVYRQNNKKKIAKRNKNYRENNKETIAKQNKRYREDPKNQDKIKAYKEKYKKKNKKKIAEKDKQYREKNRDKINAKRRMCNMSDELIEKRRSQVKAYREKNKEKLNAYARKRRSQNPIYKLGHNISNYMRNCLKDKKEGRHWEHLVGYTAKDLKKHLESLWEPWMCWENYGNPNGDHTDCWHIDHVKPMSWFNFSSYEDIGFKECWALSNLQPKAGLSNISKNNRFVG